MKNLSLNCILYLDDNSRKMAKSNITELSTYGVEVINSLRDITSQMLDKSNKVILLEGCMEKSTVYSDLVLFKEILQLEYHFLSLNEALSSSMESLASCHKTDPYSLTYDKIYGIIYDDPMLLRSVAGEFAMSETLNIAKSMTTDGNSKIKRLSESYISLFNLLDHKGKVHESLLEEKQTLEVHHQRLLEYVDQLEKYHDELLTSAIDMTRSLNQYEVIFTRDVYDKVQLSLYPRSPQIIYIKEYEELIHLNSLLDTLFQMLRYQGTNSVKILQLFDSSSSRRILTLPKKYGMLQNAYQDRDIFANDFIARVGGYKEILSTILTNVVSLDILIIVDRKDHSDLVIQGGSFLQLGTCRSSERLSVYNLDEEQTIVNAGTGDLVWSHFPEYSSFPSESEEKFMFLSSKPIMRRILEMQRAFRR